MSTARTNEQQVALLICSSLTVSVGKLRAFRANRAVQIARRLRVHDPIQLEATSQTGSSSDNAANTSIMANLRDRGIMIWCLWLNDILYALNHDLAVTSFSPRELWTKMPCSNYEFQEQYQNLLHNSQSSSHLPTDLTAEYDGFLLLMAIMSDILYVQRSLGPHAKSRHIPCATGRIEPLKHSVPLSPHSEVQQMFEMLSAALGTWVDHFQPHVSSNVMAFYFYGRLHLSCRKILDLPSAAGYNSTTVPQQATAVISTVSDHDISLAWKILDSVDTRSSSAALCPIWLPIVIFHASLVVWAHQESLRIRKDASYSSRKMLIAFKIELESMPWPCCPEMVVTLERLMDSHHLPNS